MSNLNVSLRLKLVDGLSRPLNLGRKALAGFGKSAIGLDKKLTALGNQKADINKFKSLKVSSETTRIALQKNQKAVTKLAQQMRQASKPTQTLAHKFEAAKNKSRRLKANLQSQSQQVEQVRRSLSAAGISTHALSDANRRLKSEISRTNQALERRVSIMKRNQIANEKMQVGLSMSANLSFAGIATGEAASGSRRALGSLAGAAISFESAMADVRKVVEFSEPNGLKALGKELRKLAATEIPLTSTGLAQIAAAGGQLGVAEQDLLAFTRTASKMAVAYDMLPEEAGDAMAKLSNVTGIPIGEIESLGDAINSLSDNTPAKAREIVRAMLRVGGMGRQFGLAADEAAALVGAFIAMGRPPEVAATGINAMLLRLQTATKQNDRFKSALKEIGIGAQELEDAVANDAQGALLEFMETIGAIEKQERAGLLSDLFGLEYSDDIALLVGDMRVYHKALDAATNAQAVAGSMQREFANRSATTENKLQLLNNKLNVLGSTIGDQLLPTINSAAASLGGVVQKLTRWVEANPRLVRAIVVTGAVIAGLLTVMAPLMLALASVIGSWAILRFAIISAIPSLALAGKGLLALGITSLKAGGMLLTGAVAGARLLGRTLLGLATRMIPIAITALRGLALAVMSNPIGLAIAGVGLAFAGAATLIWQHWDKLPEIFSNIIGSLQKMIGGFVERVSGWLQRPFEMIGGIGKRLRGLAGGTVTSVALGTASAAGAPAEPPAVMVSLDDMPTPIVSNDVPFTLRRPTHGGSQPQHIDRRFTGTINIQAAPGQSPEDVAREVMRLMNNNHGGLYDGH